MKSSTVAGITGAGAVLLCGLGWFVLPALQAAQTGADAKASVQLERARRVLEQYHAGLEYKSLILAQLRAAEIDVDVKEQDALLDSAEEEYRALFKGQWGLFTPTDWGESPRAVKVPAGNPSSDIRNGLTARKTILADNDKLLDRALAAVNEALAMQSGSATAAGHAESLRLKGTVLYYQALRLRMAATIKRTEAQPFLRDLADLSTRASSAAPLKELVAESKVVEKIDALRDKRADLEKAVAKDRLSLKELDAKIQDLETRRAAALARASEARRALDVQVRMGMDFRDPQGSAAFASKLTETDRAYREALREAHVLQFGDYAKAHIDDSEDYLGGKYIEGGSTGALSVRYGMTHYRSERTVFGRAVEVQERSLDELASDIARLEAQKNANTAAQERASQHFTDAVQAAQEAFKEWDRLESEAVAIEDKALKLLDQSSGACKQAASATLQWINAARESTQNLSETAKPRSALVQRLQAAWMTGFTSVQEADANLAKAWIHSTRYQEAVESVRVLDEALKGIPLPEADLEAIRTRLTEAQEAGVTAVNQAVTVLEKVHKDTGKHWTLVAQQAGTVYVLVLLGHPAFIADSIEAYRAAAKGREEKPFADIVVSRLKRLESRNP